jgi:hypothetical protein
MLKQYGRVVRMWVDRWSTCVYSYIYLVAGRKKRGGRFEMTWEREVKRSDKAEECNSWRRCKTECMAKSNWEAVTDVTLETILVQCELRYRNWQWEVQEDNTRSWLLVSEPAFATVTYTPSKYEFFRRDFLYVVCDKALLVSSGCCLSEQKGGEAIFTL